jgi:hypothetical protein
MAQKAIRYAWKRDALADKGMIRDTGTGVNDKKTKLERHAVLAFNGRKIS